MSAILSPSDFPRGSSGFTCVILGDSNTQRCNDRFGVAAVSHLNGVVTVTNDSGDTHDLWPGAEVTLTLPEGVEPEFAGRRTVTERVSSTAFRFATTPDAPPVARSQDSIIATHHGKISDLSWFQWFNGRMHGRFRLLNNAGVSSAKLAEIALLVDTEVLPYKPHYCFVLAGTNDAQQGVPMARTISNLERIYTRLRDAGIVVVALTVPPMGSAASNFTKASPRITRINQWIRDYAVRTPGLLLVDAYAALIDSTSTTGEVATSILSDGIHFTQHGAKVLGDAVYDVVSDVLPPARTALSAAFDAYGIAATTVTLSRTANTVTATASDHGFAVGDSILVTGATPADMNGLFTVLSTVSNGFTYHAPGSDGSGSGTIKAGTNLNLFDYGLFHTATGGTVTAPFTGTAATGISVSRSGGNSTAGVASVIAAPTEWHPDGLSVGNAQRLVATANASGDAAIIRSLAAQLSGRILAGHSYYAECYVKLTNVSGSNFRSIRFFLAVIVDSVTYECDALGRSLTTFPTSDFTVFLRTPIMKIPPGTMTDQYWRLTLGDASGAGTALTIDIGRVRVVQVD
jgi:lysophospholipase L1-like esterase